jgi:histidinol-phosphatase (PHP family)
LWVNKQNLAVRLGKAGSVIELNTYGIRSARQGDIGILPGQYLLRLCRQQGVAVTIGSDAHKPEEVGADFQRAKEMLSKVGYDRITTFQRRRAAQVKWME